MKFIDLTGQKYGRLTVIARAENKGKQTMWLCRCECGKEKVVNGYYLKGGQIQSCGCYNREVCSKRSKTHGLNKTQLYRVWKSMKSRCINPNNYAYSIYGGEGKSVCTEWVHDFRAFYDWAMSHGYKKGLTIERIDGTKGYSPDNCKWATMKEQQNNRRNNHLITYNGKTQTIAQWADEIGVKYYILYMRINKYHWSIERALTTK